MLSRTLVDLEEGRTSDTTLLPGKGAESGHRHLHLEIEMLRVITRQPVKVRWRH